MKDEVKGVLAVMAVLGTVFALAGLFALALRDQSPAPAAVPQPAKEVRGKFRLERLVDPDLFFLVAKDGTVCKVPPPVYAVVPPGHEIACDWRPW